MFKTSKYLTQHVNVRHLNDQKYECNNCGKAFTQKGNLNLREGQ